MNNPLLSVIIPIYNVEAYLDTCLQSIRNQTLSDLEIILVDDGSPDLCPQMCDEYARQDARIKVIHKVNAGLGSRSRTVPSFRLLPDSQRSCYGSAHFCRPQKSVNQIFSFFRCLLEIL